MHLFIIYALDETLNKVKYIPNVSEYSFIYDILTRVCKQSYFVILKISVRIKSEYIYILFKREGNMQNMVLLHSDDSLFNDIHLCTCGRQKAQPLSGWGPAVKSYYFILFNIQGKGTYTVGKQTYTIEENQGFLLEPGQKAQYQADEKEPWNCLWIGFDGRRAQEYVKEIGLGGQRLVFQNRYPEELSRIIDRMLEQNQSERENDFFLQGFLFHFLAVLVKDLSIAPEKEKQGNYYVAKALEYIRAHYENLKIQELADYVNVNRGYLYSLFMMELGVSPKEYLTTFRMTRAAELLRSTSYAIATIAASCGYQDPALFSKAFHKAYGMSPTTYKKTHREDVEKYNPA